MSSACTSSPINLLLTWSKPRCWQVVAELRQRYAIAQSIAPGGYGYNSPEWLDDEMRKRRKETAWAELDSCSAMLTALADEHTAINGFILEHHKDLFGMVPEIPAMGPTAEEAVSLAERMKAVAGQVMARDGKQHCNNEMDGTNDNDLISSKDIAHELKEKVKKVTVALTRLVKDRPYCRMEIPNDDRRGNAKYLYRRGDVMPVLKHQFGKEPT